MKDLQVPQWLNNDYFLKVLQPIVKESKVISISTDVVSKPSDSFSSPIYRVKICAARKNDIPVNHSFIVKIPSPARPLHEDVSFGNEIRFYSSTLTEMHRLLNHSGDNIALGPRVIHYSSSVNSVLILEDLSAQFYKQPTQLFQLDETLAAINKLAKWHATSIFLAKDHQDLQYSTGIFNKKYSEQLSFVYDNFVYFIDDIATWVGFGVYAEKFAALKDVFLVKGEEIFTAKPNGLNVLNHGDLNPKNLLVKDDGQRFNVKFIDYQFCVWSTPAIDIFYLLHLVVAPEVRLRRKTELILFYYNELVKSLKKMGYLAAPPTLFDLQSELLNNGFLEVIVTTCLLPFYHGDFLNTEINRSDLTEIRKAVYSNEQYRSIVKSQLKYFLHKGFLN